MPNLFYARSIEESSTMLISLARSHYTSNAASSSPTALCQRLQRLQSWFLTDGILGSQLHRGHHGFHRQHRGVASQLVSFISFLLQVRQREVPHRITGGHCSALEAAPGCGLQAIGEGGGDGWISQAHQAGSEKTGRWQEPRVRRCGCFLRRHPR